MTAQPTGGAPETKPRSGTPHRRKKLNGVNPDRFLADYVRIGSLPDLAQAYGVSTNTARQHLHALGGQMARPRRRVHLDAAAVHAALAETNNRWAAAADQLGVGYRAFARIAQEMGLTPPPSGRRKDEPQRPGVDEERLTGAELRVWLDRLGLDPAEAGKVLGVRHDTVRHWISGRERVPIRVGEELKAIEARTATAVSEVVATLHDAADPTVAIYRTDADLWAERPELQPYGARWWRMVVARATAEVPGVEIEWAR